MEPKHGENKYKVTARSLKRIEELKLPYEVGETKIRNQGGRREKVLVNNLEF